MSNNGNLDAASNDAIKGIKCNLKGCIVMQLHQQYIYDYWPYGPCMNGNSWQEIFLENEKRKRN